MFAVLGATGRIGRATIRTLTTGGYAVRAITRDASRAVELASAGCEVAIANVRDRASLEAAFAGAAAVQVICPVIARGDDVLGEMRANIDTVAAALAIVETPAVVAISDYGAQHANGTGIPLVFHHLEQRFRALDASLTFLRSAEHMQNWLRSVSSATASGIVHSMHHPITKAFPTVSAGDVGRIAAHLLVTKSGASRPRIVHVEGPRRYTALDLAAAVSAVAKRTVLARELPRPEWLPALRLGGLGESYAQLVVALYDAHNAGLIDVEAGVGELRRGTSELRDVISPPFGVVS
jgi:uncharacterized protein YbjT (DUF2867 family)